MKRIPGIRPALAALTRRNAAREVEDEFAFHLEMRTRRLLADGLSAEAAREEALRQFGDLEDALTYCRQIDERREHQEMRHELFRDIGQDIRYAARSLRRAPTVTLVAMLTLALGIGANVAVFGMLERVLFRPIPVPHAERLVALFQADAHSGETSDQISYGDFTDLRARTDVFDGVGLIVNASATIVDASGPDRVMGRRVSPELFAMLGIKPIMGRGFVPDDGREDGRVVVLAHEQWTGQFGADPSVIGRVVRLNGTPHTIIGVLPPGVDLPYPGGGTRLWLPLFDAPDRVTNRGFYGYWAVARVRVGVPPARVQTELESIAVRLEAAHPETNAARRFTARDLQEVIVGERRAVLLALAGASIFVLLIACTNLTNLLMARTTARRRELAVRAALGAGSMRIVRQLTVETLVLALASGALGIAIAVGALRAVEGLRILPPVGIDAQMLAAAAAIALLAGIGCGIWPGLAAARSASRGSLGAAARATAAPGQRRAVDALVSVEVALAFVLLVGSGLMLATVAAALRGDSGFDRQGALAFRVYPPNERYPDLATTAAYFDRVMATLEALPGVRRVAVTSTLPFGNRMGSALTRQDRPTPEGTTAPSVVYASVRPGYFAAMGIPLIRGRDFEPRDLADSQHVTIVSDETARAVFPGEDPIGRRIRLGGPASNEWHQIIGVVGGVSQDGLLDVRARAAYDLHGEHWNRAMWIVLRATGDPNALVAATRQRLRELDPEVPMFDVASMEERAAGSIGERRLLLRLLGLFGGIALVLSAVGIYGVMAQSVGQRRTELGIRLALGASASRLRGEVLRAAGLLAGIGIVAGALGALATARVLRSLLVGVSVSDPRIFVLAAVTLGGVAMSAAWIPALRASQVDPMVAMRAE